MGEKQSHLFHKFYGFENIFLIFRASRTMIKAIPTLLFVCTVFGQDRKEKQSQTGNIDWRLTPEKSQQINLLDSFIELQEHLENWKIIHRYISNKK